MDFFSLAGFAMNVYSFLQKNPVGAETQKEPTSVVRTVKHVSVPVSKLVPNSAPEMASVSAQAGTSKQMRSPAPAQQKGSRTTPSSTAAQPQEKQQQRVTRSNSKHNTITPFRGVNTHHIERAQGAIGWSKVKKTVATESPAPGGQMASLNSNINSSTQTDSKQRAAESGVDNSGQYFFQRRVSTR